MGETVADSVLAGYLREAEADSATLGLVLHGSRAAGCATAESDYDLERVLTDDAFRDGEARGALDLPKTRLPGGVIVDLWFTCPEKLRAQAGKFDWETPAYATAKVLFDRTGEVAELIRAIAQVPAETAEREVPFWFDGYLNAFYRSLKAYRRGNELGARLQAAESVMHLMRTLFMMAGIWTPYHDRLMHHIDTLAVQGWDPPALKGALLEILRTADPHLQIELEEQVERLLCDRGFGKVIDDWEGELERAKAWYVSLESPAP